MPTCPTCHADRELTPAGVCATCARRNLLPAIPGEARGLFGHPPGVLFDVAEETGSERRALKRARKDAAKPATETVSPADDLKPPPPTPDLPGQRRLFD